MKKNRPTFRHGQNVEWTSQANGKSRTKRGRVYLVLAAHNLPWAGDFRETHSDTRKIGGGPRDHESYLVEVDNGIGRKPSLYWPVVSQLRPVEETNNEAALV